MQGMSLSGGEMPEAQERIAAGLKSDFPNTSKHYHVCTDTFGSIATAFPNGESVMVVYTCLQQPMLLQEVWW